MRSYETAATASSATSALFLVGSTSVLAASTLSTAPTATTAFASSVPVGVGSFTRAAVGGGWCVPRPARPACVRGHRPADRRAAGAGRCRASPTMVHFRVECTLPLPADLFWELRDTPAFLKHVVDDKLLTSITSTPPTAHPTLPDTLTRTQSYTPATVACPDFLRPLVGSTAFAVTDHQTWAAAPPPPTRSTTKSRPPSSPPSPPRRARCRSRRGQRRRPCPCRPPTRASRRRPTRPRQTCARTLSTAPRRCGSCTLGALWRAPLSTTSAPFTRATRGVWGGFACGSLAPMAPTRMGGGWGGSAPLRAATWPPSPAGVTATATASAARRPT
ncbi:hypothetical protein BU14_0027s0094 [Porphyra umbilicalis]|uniref:Coenzyme Q-binding protein COQ10 START domain-containing protein n=1 Tax=Porphyra umbilicalis TaxID=2786 RepID=A0A1X6PK29_PORUM|nr:hypothetical protein BU14_0027s0094 [Porphyra umbilicalis]|eukprot:OSX81068.1 hypothetical protein BU14_0027s0094 [Porphyra umbilicalis]